MANVACTTHIKSGGYLNPHLDANEGYIHLPRHSLYHLLVVSSVLVIPSRVDNHRLERAIEKLLGYWPLMSGRLEYRPSPANALSDVAIRLGSTIPLMVSETPDTAQFSDNTVVQDSLGEFCPSLEMSYPIPGSDTPLAAFQLVHTPEGSVLGMTASHGIVDGQSANLALHHLSRLYQDLSTDLGAESPSLGPSVQYPQADEASQGQFDLGWYEPVPISEMFQDLAMSVMESESVTVSLSRGDIEFLKANAFSQISEGDNGWLSSQDVISGWWVSLLSRIGEPVEKIWYAVNYRDLFPSNPNFPPSVTTNHYSEIVFVAIPVSDPEDMVSTAKDIRKGLETLKADPTAFAGYIRDVGETLCRGSEAGMGLRIVPPPRAIVINSNLKYDWTPSLVSGQVTQYYTEHVCRRFLRVFRANNRDASGRWDGSVELASQVSSDMADRFRDLVRTDRSEWTE